jgi:hypothetical protein
MYIPKKINGFPQTPVRPTRRFPRYAQMCTSADMFTT